MKLFDLYSACFFEDENLQNIELHNAHSRIQTRIPQSDTLTTAQYHGFSQYVQGVSYVLGQAIMPSTLYSVMILNYS